MKKYAIISNKKRNELIERVIKIGQSVSKVSKQLRMKLPSAKSILRTYKKSGKIFDKKKIINRKIKTKKSDLSQTENYSCVQMSNGQKMDEIIVKEETVSKGQTTQNFQKECLSPAPSSPFKFYTGEADLAQQYFEQLYFQQSMNYYYNLLAMAQNQIL